MYIKPPVTLHRLLLVLSAEFALPSWRMDSPFYVASAIQFSFHTLRPSSLGLWRTMASQLYPSIGFHGFYGLSAAFDFTEAIEASVRTVAVVDEPLRILLVGPGDVRHMLATVSRRRRHRTKDIMKCKESKRMRPIHFYFIETPIEVLARNILLLELANDYEVPIRQRASTFLEIFGNCRVQDRTAKYIEQLGQQLRSLVTAGTGRLEDLIDLSLLKYRERDNLENAFKSYSRATSFDVDSLRDHRLRGKLFRLNLEAKK